jgi:hypothetical protein
MKRAATRLGTLVGLVLVICSVMGFLLLGTQGTWHSELRVPAGRTAVVIEPALASVMGPSISVHAQADSDVPLFIGRARPDDTDALLESSDRLVVTGLDGARRLHTSRAQGSDPLPAPASVDIWHRSTTGEGQTRLSYHAARGAQSAVVARADGAPLPALSVTVSWSNRTWYWIPLVLLLAGLGLILWLRRWSRPPTRVGAAAAAARRRRSAAARRPARRGAGGHVGRRRATTSRRR